MAKVAERGIRLPHVTKPCLYRDFNDKYRVSAASIASILPVFPNIRELSFDFWTDIKDLVLQEFLHHFERRTACQLEALAIDHCYHVSSEHIGRLVVCARGSLVHLSTNGLDQETVTPVKALISARAKRQFHARTTAALKTALLKPARFLPIDCTLRVPTAIIAGLWY